MDDVSPSKDLLVSRAPRGAPKRPIRIAMLRHRCRKRVVGVLTGRIPRRGSGVRMIETWPRLRADPRRVVNPFSRIGSPGPRDGRSVREVFTARRLVCRLDEALEPRTPAPYGRFAHSGSGAAWGLAQKGGGAYCVHVERGIGQEAIWGFARSPGSWIHGVEAGRSLGSPRTAHSLGERGAVVRISIWHTAVAPAGVAGEIARFRI